MEGFNPHGCSPGWGLGVWFGCTLPKRGAQKPKGWVKNINGEGAKNPAKKKKKQQTPQKETPENQPIGLGTPKQKQPKTPGCFKKWGHPKKKKAPQKTEKGPTKPPFLDQGNPMVGGVWGGGTKKTGPPHPTPTKPNKGENHPKPHQL